MFNGIWEVVGVWQRWEMPWYVDRRGGRDLNQRVVDRQPTLEVGAITNLSHTQTLSILIYAKITH